MFTVTFYSFRGGVGRTMALVNAAYLLARKGLDVFVVDFDLEAPGISFMPDWQPGQGGKPKEFGGLVAYLGAGIAGGVEALPSLEDLSYVPHVVDLKPLKGKIRVLPAGDLRRSGKNYSASDIVFSKLYEDEKGIEILDRLKAEIQERFSPAYTLIDSRTGLTEISGICTLYLPDLLVFVSGLSIQHFDGGYLILKRLKNAQPDIASRLLVVASPVPDGYEDAVEKRLNALRVDFSDALGGEIIEKIFTIPYHPSIAMSEDTFVARFPETPLTQAYKCLANALRERNDSDRQYSSDRLLDALPVDIEKNIKALISLGEIPQALEIKARLAELLSSLSAPGTQDSTEAPLQQRLKSTPEDGNPGLQTISKTMPSFSKTKPGQDSEENRY